MRSTRLVVAALAVATGVGTIAAPAVATPAAATGTFNEYAAGPGLGYDVGGHAQLVRTSDGRTIVTVVIQGLVPDTGYGVHVHDGSCAALGGHYFFDGPVPGGDGPNGDELWPGPVTANAGGTARGKATVDATADTAAASVVVHAPGGARIACADL